MDSRGHCHSCSGPLVFHFLRDKQKLYGGGPWAISFLHLTFRLFQSLPIAILAPFLAAPPPFLTMGRVYRVPPGSRVQGLSVGDGPPYPSFSQGAPLLVVG